MINFLQNVFHAVFKMIRVGIKYGAYVLMAFPVIACILWFFYGLFFEFHFYDEPGWILSILGKIYIFVVMLGVVFFVTKILLLLLFIIGKLIESITILFDRFICWSFKNIRILFSDIYGVLRRLFTRIYISDDNDSRSASTIFFLDDIFDPRNEPTRLFVGGVYLYACCICLFCWINGLFTPFESSTIPTFLIFFLTFPIGFYLFVNLMIIVLNMIGNIFVLAGRIITITGHFMLSLCELFRRLLTRIINVI